VSVVLCVWILLFLFFKEKWERASTYEDVVNAFMFFDTQRTGQVSAELMKGVLTTIGDVFSGPEADQFLRDAGRDPINYAEFVRTMLGRANL